MDTEDKSIYIGQVDYSTEPDDLEKLFSQAGTVVRVSIPLNPWTGGPQGFAYLEFTDAAAQAEAVNLFNGFSFKGRELKVTPKRVNVAGKGGKGEGKGSKGGKGDYNSSSTGKGSGGKGKGSGKGGKGYKGGKGGSLLSQWTIDANEVSVDEALPTNSRHGNSSIAWPSEADEPLQPPAAPPAKPKTVAKAAEILAKHSVVATSEARGVPEAATTKKRDLASRLGAKPGAATANAATITTAARQGQSLPSSSSSAAAHPPKKARGVQDSTSSKASAAPVEAKPVDVSAVKVKSFAELMAEKRAAAAAASGAGAGSAPASVVESNTIGSSKNNNGSSRNAAAKETNTSAGESEARMENNHTEEKNEATASSSAEADAGDDAALPGSSSSFHIGQRVVAQFGGVGGEWFPGTVAARHDADNTYDVAYDDGDAESQKPADQLVDAAALGV